VNEALVSTRRTAVFIAGMIVVFVVGLLAVKARQPEPVRVTESCRSAFDQYAIAHDTGSLVTTIHACANGQGATTADEWFKSARQALKVGQREAETLYRQACDAAGAQRRLPENICGFLE
jgi:hypothetical protein